MDFHDVQLKLWFALLLFLAALGGMWLPFRLRSSPRARNLLSLGNMLSAGVMLGGGVLHLLPDSIEALESVSGEYPFGFLSFAIGLLLPLVVEQSSEALCGQPRVKRRGASRPLVVSNIPLDPRISHDGAGAQSTASESDMDLLDVQQQEHHSSSVHDTHELMHPLASMHAAPTYEVPKTSACVLLLALTFHSVLEGIAQGSTVSSDLVIKISIVVLVHKGLAAFALGCLFVQTEFERAFLYLLSATFALATPIGVVCGIILQGFSEDSLWSSVLTAAAGGSFCYVALIEVLARELHRVDVNKLAQLALLLLGFTMMAVIALWV